MRPRRTRASQASSRARAPVSLPPQHYLEVGLDHLFRVLADKLLAHEAELLHLGDARGGPDDREDQLADVLHQLLFALHKLEAGKELVALHLQQLVCVRLVALADDVLGRDLGLLPLARDEQVPDLIVEGLL